MDTLEFRIIPAKDMIEDWMDDWTEDDLNNRFLVSIFVNGTDLIDTIRDIELPYQTAAGYPENAGDYGHNTVEHMEWQFREALQPGTYSYDSGIELFCCPDCGEGGCWSVMCRFRKENGVISMTDFHHNHRSWEYDICYRFSEENYYTEIKKIKAATEERNNHE